MSKENRSRPRTNLRSPLYLFSAALGVLVETETENVSMNGFFCRTNRVYAPGERFRFLLQLSPTVAETQGARPVYLDGVAEVVHVKVGASAQGFGLGCRVEGYRVLPQSHIRNKDDIRTILSEPYRLELGNESGREICLENLVLS